MCKKSRGLTAMAYAHGYDYDVFISFSLADNSRMNPEKRDGWVDRFQRELLAALMLRLGPATKIFYSERDAQTGNFDLPAFLELTKRCAVMVAVASRNYVREEAYTLKELNTFVGCRGKESLFVAQILPYVENDPNNDILKQRIAKKFWYETDEGYPAPLSPTTEEKRDTYTGRIGDFAEAISEHLRKVSPRPAAGVGATRPLGTVLLAQATDDLETVRDGIRRYLEQFNVSVLPAAGVDYPSDPVLFADAFKADLARADLFVQLLSDKPGRRPDNFVARQAELAAEKPTAQWRSATLAMDKVPEAQRTLLEGPKVLVDTIENFNASVIARLRRPPPPPPPPRGQQLVFINHDSQDQTLADRFSKMIRQKGHVPAQRLSKGLSQQLREDLEGNIVDCDAMLLVYGLATNVWVRSQLRRYNKIKVQRDAPVARLWLCTAEPKPKDSLEMDVPEELVEIDPNDLEVALGEMHP